LAAPLRPLLHPRFFAATKVLGPRYWTGIFRNGSFSPYAQPDWSFLLQAPSNDPSYAHW
jgi:hypothetical protein